MTFQVCLYSQGVNASDIFFAQLYYSIQCSIQNTDGILTPAFYFVGATMLLMSAAALSVVTLLKFNAESSSRLDIFHAYPCVIYLQALFTEYTTHNTMLHEMKTYCAKLLPTRSNERKKCN